MAVNHFGLLYLAVPGKKSHVFGIIKEMVVGSRVTIYAYEPHLGLGRFFHNADFNIQIRHYIISLFPEHDISEADILIGFAVVFPTAGHMHQAPPRIATDICLDSL
jgi:hypothetical protein